MPSQAGTKGGTVRRAVRTSVPSLLPRLQGSPWTKLEGSHPSLGPNPDPLPVPRPCEPEAIDVDMDPEGPPGDAAPTVFANPWYPVEHP